MPENSKYDLLSDYEVSTPGNNKNAPKEKVVAKIEAPPEEVRVPTEPSKYPDLFSDYEIVGKENNVKKSSESTNPLTIQTPDEIGKLESFGKGAAQGIRNIANTRGIIESGFGGTVGKVIGKTLGAIPGGEIAKKGADLLQGISGKNKEQIQEKIRTEKAALAPYKEAHPILTGGGEMLTESIPSLIAGGGAGTALRLAGAGIAKRVGAQAAIGAAEGSALAAGKGGNAENIAENAIIGGGVAGTLEAVLPAIAKPLAKGARLVWQKTFGKTPIPKEGLITPDGKPTPALQEALKQEGRTFEDLTKDTIQEIKKADPNALPEDVLRKAGFESVGAPSTKGDVTQLYEAKRSEAQALEANPEIGAPLRDIKTDQAAAYKNKLEEIIQKSGVPEDAGEKVKSVLTSVNAADKKELREYYKTFREGAEDIPIPTQELDPFKGKLGTQIADKIDLDTFRELHPAQANSIDNALVRFGIEKDPALVEKYLASNPKRTITPLSFKNFDEFSKVLNNIASSDATNTTSLITKPIKEALDDQVQFAIKYVGDTADNTELAGTLKKAKELYIKNKENFNPKSMSGKLIGNQKNSTVPIIDNDSVFRNLFSKSKDKSTYSNLKQTLDNLERGGAEGKKAIGNLQARAVLELLNSGLEKAPEIGGKKTFNAAAYNKLLEGFGDKELKLLFKNNPEAVKNLYQVGRNAKNATPSRYEVPKGSGSIIIQAIDGLRLGILFRNTPFLAGFYENVGKLGKAHQNKKALENALKNNPRLKETEDTLKKFPALYSLLESNAVSASSLNPPEEEEKK